MWQFLIAFWGRVRFVPPSIPGTIAVTSSKTANIGVSLTRASIAVTLTAFDLKVTLQP